MLTNLLLLIILPAIFWFFMGYAANGLKAMLSETPSTVDPEASNPAPSASEANTAPLPAGPQA
jgi:hypothetical protein